MMLAAFNPVVPGSSISHYEAVAFRTSSWSGDQQRPSPARSSRRSI
jgi:hypothetical protein